MSVTQVPYSGPRKLVLAFDVGTTYSGISYCILQPGQIPELRGITRFPGQGSGHGNAKVPSILYYDERGNVKAVGSESLSMNVIEKAMDEGWTKAEWWKLHLRPKHLASAHITEDDIPPLPHGKTAVDVLADFIKYLFKCTKNYIQEHHPGFNWSSIENSIEFIFSHPNGWEGLQQQQYREAIQRAGVIPSTPEGQSRVHMITEGEASLHYCVSSLSSGSADSGPQGIVIIDAGGGTIDLSMYSMTSNPLSCNEVAPAECRLQGSVFVTRRAAAVMRKKLQGSPHCNDDDMEVLAREFDQNTKLTISSANEPTYVKLSTNLRYNNPKYGIKRGALTLSGAEVASLFDDSIKAIIDAFEQQRKAAKTKITMAFLVGGLGINELLWTRLQSHFQAQGINISRPDNDINKAVANGAVLFHINRDRHLVKSRAARAAYGVPIEDWVDDKNPEHRRRRDQWKRSACGKYVVGGAFRPILLKGDQIDEQKEIRLSLSAERTSPTDFKQHADIMCYRGSLSNPQWTDEDSSSFSRLCRIWADLSKAAGSSAALIADSGETYYRVSFEVVALFGKTELTAQIVWMVNGQEQRAPATIVYYDD